MGGAVRATRRLADGLRRRGHDVRIISLNAQRAADGIGITSSDPMDGDRFLALHANEWLQRDYIAPRRTTVSNTYFAAQVAGYSLADPALLEPFDLLNVHWSANLLAPHTLAELIGTDRPVLCTLHDMAAFTGGCHYSAGCRRYQQQCSPCPQLQDDPLELTRWTLEQKRRYRAADHFGAIAPSRWLADCAAASGLFRPDRVYTIPNALDTDIFRPTAKPFAKSLLGVDPNASTLLFAAADNRERRKGFDLLTEVWRHLERDPRIATLIAERRIRVLVCGEGADTLQAEGVPLQDLGAVRNDSRLALIYSAADLVILSSREDNLPNVLLEAMACGTPAVAFDVGGVPDLIDDRIDGRLIPPFDTAAMSRAIAELLAHEDSAAAMGLAARARIAEHHHLDSQASAYEELFRSLVDRSPARKPPASSLPSTVACPVTVNPRATRYPLRLYLEQCERFERCAQRQAESAQRIERANEVLGTAIGEVLDSRCWRYTRPLRRRSQEPAIDPTADPEQRAVLLLNLLRSKSWEATGLLRLLSRAVNAVSRRLTAWRRRHPLERQATTPADSLPPWTFTLEAAVGARHSPVSHERPGRNVICLHLFHLDLWEEFRIALKPLIGPLSPLYVTLPPNHAHFIPELYREFGGRHCQAIVVDNRGMDIYPFLYVFDLLSRHDEHPLTLTKLHTKKSVHHGAESAENWRKDLYRDLLNHHADLARQFQDETLAMVCSRKWWVHEDETSANFQIERSAIEAACRIFSVSPTEYYLSGSMYMVSFDYLQKLFIGVDRDRFLARFPAGYRRSQTLAHGFERVVCYGVEKFALKVGLL